MARKTPREDELKAAVRHIRHEAEMLQSAWERHQGDAHAWVGWYVHMRTLMEFFNPEGKCTVKRDHVLAWQYFRDHPDSGKTKWRTEWAKHTEPPLFDKFREAANKLAAHLTFIRIPIAEATWYADGGKYPPSEEITKYLLDLWETFLKTIPQARSAWFEAETG